MAPQNDRVFFDMSIAAADQNKTHSLDGRVQGVRRRCERLLLCYSVSWFLTIVVVASFLLGLADYLFRFQDLGIRWIATGGLLGVSVTASYLLLVQPFARRRLSNLQTAQRIEARFPELRDRLSSAIAFLEQGDRGVRGDSLELRRTVIEEASVEIEQLDLADCIDSRVPRRAAILTLCTLAVVGWTCYSDTEAAWLAGRRLIMPWRTEDWPRWNTLSFFAPPQKIGVGDDFEVELIDLNGHLPQQVTIEYLFDSKQQVDSRSMRRVGDRMVDRYVNVRRSFQYRAFGGDDDTMPWHHVQVVTPPDIKDLKIRLVPPAYTGQPAEESGRHIRALEGTRIEVSGRANKPLQRISWAADFEDPVFDSPPQLGEDFRSFSAPAGPLEFRAQTSGEFWFGWSDRDGILRHESLLCKLRVLEDLPPTVELEWPLRVAFVAVHATVPLRTRVRDDIRIERVMLRFGDQERILSGQPHSPQDRSGDELEISYDWELGELENLAAGDVIEFQIVAQDGRPQEGSSGVRRLQIVAAAELDRRTQQRRSQIQAELQRLLDTQRKVRSHVKAIQIQLEETDFSLTRLEDLQSVELNQRQVRQGLTDIPHGIAEQVEQLLGHLENNRIEDRTTREAMSNLGLELADLKRAQLAPIEDLLATTVKQFRGVLSGALPSSSQQELINEDLDSVGQFQDEVIARLQRMLEFQQQDIEVSEVAGELNELIHEQQQIRGATQQMPTIGKGLRSLSPVERADLKQLAQRQRELAQAFDRIQAVLRRAAAADARSEASLAAGRAIAQAERDATSGLMREAVQDLEKNRIGQAAQSQRSAEQLLREMNRALTSEQSMAGKPGTESLADLLHRNVVTLLRTQESLLETTIALDAQTFEDETAAQQAWASVADEQGIVGRQTDQLVRDHDTRPAVTFVLTETAADMGLAGERLARGELRGGVLLQEAAVRRLRILEAALQKSLERISPDATQPAESSGGADDADVQVSELQLLREIQLEINRRTLALGGRVDDVADGGARRELARLADEQERLSETVLQLQADSQAQLP